MDRRAHLEKHYNALSPSPNMIHVVQDWTGVIARILYKLLEAPKDSNTRPLPI